MYSHYSAQMLQCFVNTELGEKLGYLELGSLCNQSLHNLVGKAHEFFFSVGDIVVHFVLLKLDSGLREVRGCL